MITPCQFRSTWTPKSRSIYCGVRRTLVQCFVHRAQLRGDHMCGPYQSCLPVATCDNSSLSALRIKDTWVLADQKIGEGKTYCLGKGLERVWWKGCKSIGSWLARLFWSGSSKSLAYSPASYNTMYLLNSVLRNVTVFNAVRTELWLVQLWRAF